MGNYYVVASYLFKHILDAEIMTAPKITSKTIEIGSKYSPEFVCTPFKYTLGTMIEALEKGANVLLQAGGGCRYRYYAEVQETILKDLGYNFKFIQIIGKDHLRFKELYQIFKNLNPKLTKRKFIKSVINAIFYINFL